MFRRFFERALDLVAPRFCAGCDAPLGAEDLFCATCEPSAEGGSARAPLGSGIVVVALGRYDGALARAIQTLKYRSRPDLATPFGRRLGRALAREVRAESALLVPVPLHPKKLAERGYNQSALVATSAAREIGWEVRPRALGRIRDTGQQAKLGRSERFDNMFGAIAVREHVAGRRVVLVDDVVTTGATASVCRDALQHAGATLIAVAAVARA